MATNNHDLVDRVRNQECRACGATEPAYVMYRGHFMGWFCNDHRPDRRPDAKTAADVMPCYVQGGGIEVYPVEMNNKRHPFHKICQDRIRRGLGRFDKIVTTFGPRPSGHMNRAQRRAMKRL